MTKENKIKTWAFLMRLGNKSRMSPNGREESVF